MREEKGKKRSGYLRSRQLRFGVVDQTKRTLAGVLILLVLVLVILPFWTSVQDVLTRFIMRVGWYRTLQNWIVPYELRIIGTVLTLVGMPIRVGQAYIEWTGVSGGNEVIYLAWNCVGWQTLVLFVITLFTGLSGEYKLLSKLETLAIGVLGTYLVNIFRLALVVVVYFLVGRPFGIVFHDYFSNIFTLVWLFFFWWFAYAFVLEEKLPPLMDVEPRKESSQASK
jgi:exosortase/archaeosortase family protein